MKTNTKRSFLALLIALAIVSPTLAAGEPGNVGNVKAIPKDATTLTVSWDEVKDAQGNPVHHYRLYYGTASVQNFKAAQYEIEVDTPTNATSYDLTALTTNTPYYIAVTAFDASEKESEQYSVEVSGTPSNQPVAAADTVAPTVTNVIAADKTHVLVKFSEKIVLPAVIPEAAFVITEEASPEKMLDVKTVKMYEDDMEGKTVILETADQTQDSSYTITVGVAVTDVAGNPIQTGNSDSGLFKGSNVVKSGTVNGTQTPTQEELDQTKPAATENTTTTPEDLLKDTTTPTSPSTTNTTNTTTTKPTTPTTQAPVTPTPDTTAPEDVRNLMLTVKEQIEKFAVVMNWDASLDTAKDLAKHMIYMSTDMGATFDAGISLGKDAVTYEMANLEGGKEYTFKVTTMDANGNESVGVVKSIKLPSTGFGAGFLVLTSAYGANRYLKRRRQKMAEKI